MTSSQRNVDFILEQISGAGSVSAKKMFGEYALYCDGKMVALVCDDKLFVKPTQAGRAFAGSIAEEPPYPQAKPYLLIDEDRWDDADWLADLIKCSAAQLSVPKKKPPKKDRRIVLQASDK